jgi:hypothetical protein
VADTLLRHRSPAEISLTKCGVVSISLAGDWFIVWDERALNAECSDNCRCASRKTVTVAVGFDTNKATVATVPRRLIAFPRYLAWLQKIGEHMTSRVDVFTPLTKAV